MNKINFSPDSMKEFLEDPFKKGSVMKFLMMLGASVLADTLIFAFMFVIANLIGAFITFFRLDFSGKPLAVVLFLMSVCTFSGYCLLRLLVCADSKIFRSEVSDTLYEKENADAFHVLMFVTYVIVYIVISAVHVLLFGIMDNNIYEGFILANPSLLAALFMVRSVTRGNELLRKRIKTVLMFLFWIVTVIAWWPIVPMLT